MTNKLNCLVSASPQPSHGPPDATSKLVKANPGTSFVSRPHFPNQIKDIALFAGGILLLMGKEIYHYIASWDFSHHVQILNGVRQNPRQETVLDKAKEQLVSQDRRNLDRISLKKSGFQEKNLKINPDNAKCLKSANSCAEDIFFSPEANSESVKEEIRSRLRPVEKEKFMAAWNKIVESDEELVAFAALCACSPFKICQDALANAWSILLGRNPNKAYELALACSKSGEYEFYGNRKIINEACQKLLQNDCINQTEFSLEFVKCHAINSKKKGEEFLASSLDFLMSKKQYTFACRLIDFMISRFEDKEHPVVHTIYFYFSNHEKLDLVLELAKTCTKFSLYQGIVENAFSVFLNKDRPELAFDLVSECLRLDRFELCGCAEILENAMKCFLILGAFEIAENFYKSCKKLLKVSLATVSNEMNSLTTKGEARVEKIRKYVRQQKTTMDEFYGRSNVSQLAPCPSLLNDDSNQLALFVQPTSPK